MMITMKRSMLSLLVLLSSLVMLTDGESSSIRGGRGTLVSESGVGSEHLNNANKHRFLGREASNFASNINPVGSSSIATPYGGHDDYYDDDWEKYCIPADSRTYSLTTDERNNAQWINEARTTRGLGSLPFLADLVVEAKRWAKYLASRNSWSVVTRDFISRNIFCDTWHELGEYDVSNRNVSKSGAFAYMMNGRGRAYILYKPYDGLGIGIARNGSKYFMVTLFKNRV